jgi:hypothetical protein
MDTTEKTNDEINQLSKEDVLSLTPDQIPEDVQLSTSQLDNLDKADIQKLNVKLKDAIPVEKSEDLIVGELVKELFTNAALKPEYAELSATQICEKINAPRVVAFPQVIVEKSRLALLMEKALADFYIQDTITLDAAGKINVTNEDMQTHINNVIQSEIANDPQGYGYKDKTPEEQLAMLHAPQTRTEVKTEESGPLWYVLVAGIPHAPNICSVEFVELAIGRVQNG